LFFTYRNRHPASKPFDERTFRYVLRLEQRRSDRSGRPFLLVLLDAGNDRAGSALVDVNAGTIFTILSRCLRDTDLIGWYEDGRRVAAVLTELGDGPEPDIREVVSEKVTRGLFERLPADIARRLHIEVFRYPGPPLP
jgi:hypothetical protein